MKRFLIGAAALTTLAWVSPAQACDGYAIETVQISGQSYDPSQVTGQLIRLSLEPSSLSEDCAALSSYIRPRDGAGRITLQRRGDMLIHRAVVSGQVDHAAASRIELSAAARQALARGGRVVLDLFEVEPGQFVPPGDYVADLEWFIDGQSPQPFQVAVRVEPAVRFVGDEVRRLSLGEVSNGGEARSSFLYATNASLRVTARSQHGGRLQHEMGAALGSIAYSAYLSGQKLDLASPAPVTLPFQRAVLTSEELRVQVPPQPGRYAGSYRDVLTLEFVAY